MRSRSLLTNMEKSVMAKIAEGKSRQEVADDLCVAWKTVCFHLNNAYRKLGAKNAIHAVSLARAKGEIA